MLVALAGTVVISFANYGMGPVMSSAESLLARLGMQVGAGEEKRKGGGWGWGG
jgi:hypothetical protein